MAGQKATHQQTRALNEGLVLRTLYDHAPISRADVARLTGLTRTTVSDVVSEFIADGLAREIGRGPSSGGKAPILLDVVGDARLVIGLDLGEEKFVGALVNLRGEVREVVAAPVVGRNASERLVILQQLVDTLHAGGKDRVLGIGVATPGLVDTERGTIGPPTPLGGRISRSVPSCANERTCPRTSRTTRVPWRWASITSSARMPAATSS